MELDDLSAESGAGIAAALVAALLLSPRVRGLLRRGAVAGLAAVIATGDTVGGLFQQVVGGGNDQEPLDATFAHDLAREARGELAHQSHPHDRPGAC